MGWQMESKVGSREINAEILAYFMMMRMTQQIGNNNNDLREEEEEKDGIYTQVQEV